MTNRERALAVLNYASYDRLPIVHFGYWSETLEKWHQEGHLTEEEATTWYDRSPVDQSICAKLGFDFDWYPIYQPWNLLYPWFETEVVEELPDGTQYVRDGAGVITLHKPGAGSIPAEIDHLLKDRASWEEHFKPRLQYSAERMRDYGVEAAESAPDMPIGLHCGSLFGEIRNWLGVEGTAYLYADDEDLFTEIIDTVGDLSYRCAEAALTAGIRYDYGHFWEDICFKNGPLINPDVFNEKVGPHYRRITDLLRRHGIELVSLDCDGKIDALIPTWFPNGVNIMFPIEVGTWNANIAPWRAEYGRELRGVGGMDKKVFAYDYAAVDAEIERLRPLVELGGFIPCPDHRIAPDAKWENVQYYCAQMRKAFGG
jgi:uroporphyrinogen decarboxylase